MSEFKNKLYVTFDFDVTQTEWCINITHVTWKSKTRPEHHFNMHSNVKQYFIDYS